MLDEHLGHETVVIGAGPAGLACAAALQAIGGSVTLLERANEMAPAWRGHYDRLHLHTPKRHSGLPGLPMPREYPDYPSRDQVISYLKNYAARHKITPRLGVSVLKVVRRDKWVVETSTGAVATDNVIFATGLAGQPVRALRLSQIPSAWLGTANRAMELVHVGPAQPDQVVAP